jgi:transcriptional regulator with XRE-family HTH domain
LTREPDHIVGLRRDLGAQLSLFRQAARLTQAELSGRVYCDRSTLAHIEKGRSRGSAQFWEAADRVTAADGALLAAFNQLESVREQHAAAERQATFTQTQAKANALRGGAPAAETATSLPHEMDHLGLAYSASLPDTVNAVAELGRRDMERRKFLSGAMFSVAASVAPSLDWLLATLDEASSARGKISSTQVEAIRRTFGVFQELDVMRGGGHARHQLAGYLTSHVVPLLRANDPSSPTGTALYESAAEQLYLLGWMAFDSGEHGLAQRYLIQSLRLAQECGSPELGAHVLAGLSDQATLTGHPKEGIRLAKAGRAGLAQGQSAACLADLHALQARAEAAMGMGPEAARNVHLSEEAFASVDPTNEPEWARFIDVAYLNGEYAHTFRDLHRPREAAAFAEVSIADARRQNRARRGSLAHAAAARAALDTHDLEAAAAAGTAAATLGATVDSSRSVDAVTDLRSRLAEHRDSAAVRDFMEVSATLMPALAT